MVDTIPAFQLLYPLTWSHQIRAHFDDPADHYSGNVVKRREGMMFVPQGTGQTLEVRAAQRGVVQEVGNYPPGYGIFARITHAWYGDTYVSWYGHLASARVQVGQYVNAGEVIGIAGQSGSAPEVNLFLTLQHIGRGRRQYVVDDVINPEPLLVQQLTPRSEMWWMADVTIDDGSLMSPGQAFKKVWQVRNAGNTAWTGTHKLVYHSGNPLGPGTAVPLPPAQPGALVQVAVEMVAPQTAGEYRSDWIGQDPDRQSFSYRQYALIRVQGGSGEAPKTSLARFVRDVTIPDKFIVRPGASFTKTWRIRNGGQSTWGTGFVMVYDSGEPMNGPASVALPALRPNQEGDVSVTLIAPSTPGTYRSYWKPRDAQGNPFEFAMYVEITVEEPRPENTQDRYVTPVVGNYSIGWRYMVAVPYGDGKHKGVDYIGPVGLPIRAGATGIVHKRYLCSVCTPDRPNFNSHNLSEAERTTAFNNLTPWTWGFGNLVIVRYAWADLPVKARNTLSSIGATNWYAYVYYAHLNEVYVKDGDQVFAGTQLGTMGNTGNSTASHLHLEIRAAASATNMNNYRRIDPELMFET